MWIISQDRLRVLYTERVEVRSRTLLADHNGEEIRIGEFNSHERAKEELKIFTHALIQKKEVFEVAIDETVN